MASTAKKYIPFLDPNGQAGKFVQADINYEVVSVTVLATATTGTATITTGSIILGWYPTAQDQIVKSIGISGTTLTVTLGAAATANNTFSIALLKV